MTSPPPPSATVEQLLAKAFPFRGQPYRFGAELALTGPESVGPVDCSELFQVAGARAGVVPPIPDGAYYQWRHCINHGLGLPVAEAARIRGALLFVGDGTGVGREAVTHVAISLGDGTTFEARGVAWGVGSWQVANRFDFAGLIPGVSYQKATAPLKPGAPMYSKDDADFIVARLFPVIVGRPADESGAAFWSGVFQSSDPLLALANLCSAPESVETAQAGRRALAAIDSLTSSVAALSRSVDVLAANAAGPPPAPPVAVPAAPGAGPARPALEAVAADLRALAATVSDVASIV